MALKFDKESYCERCEYMEPEATYIFGPSYDGTADRNDCIVGCNRLPICREIYKTMKEAAKNGPHVRTDLDLDPRNNPWH